MEEMDEAIFNNLKKLNENKEKEDKNKGGDWSPLL
jgi:uncharacterized protein YegL